MTLRRPTLPLIIIGYFFICAFLSWAPGAWASGENSVAVTAFKPRFMSIKGTSVTVRLGPGRQYPIAWVYHRNALPVRVLEEFDQWYRITDYSQQTGWVRKNALSEKRHVLIFPAETSSKTVAGAEVSSRVVIPMYKSKNSSKEIAFLERYVVADLIECHEACCKILVDGYKGWVNKKDVWGLLTDE